jgi:hypothetical protein
MGGIDVVVEPGAAPTEGARIRRREVLHGALGRQEATDLPAGDVGVNLLRREVDIDDVVSSQDGIEGQRYGGK